jgi:imidazole glycerol-phosphate synthase subunit HisH
MRLLEEPVEIAVVDYGMGNRRSVEKAFEHIGARGLGLIAGEVRQLPRSGTPSGVHPEERAHSKQAGEHGALKLPHIGWNEVTFSGGSPLNEGLPERCAFYHVHSFAPVPSCPEEILGTSVYGAPFASVIAHKSFYGVQFHPEKSSAAGLRLLANFARICQRSAVTVGS